MKQIRSIIFLPLLLVFSALSMGQEIQQQSISINQLLDENNSWQDIEGMLLIEIPDIKIENYVMHKNLSLYLITGNVNLVDATNIQTLDEALKSKTATVTETGNVNQLSVKNTSNKKDLFINSGDIVKGGKQDRTLTFDLWVPKNSDTDLASFCVERDRWNQRGSENVSSFNENKYVLSSRQLKIANVVKNSQGEVWQNVSAQQESLSSNISADVKSEISKSSLQLTLENDSLKKEIALYEKAFAKFALEKNAIGFAYAINGELYGADIYASPLLFQKVREKVLMSVIVEAISDVSKAKKEIPNPPEVEKAMNQIVREDSTHYKINNGFNLSLKWSSNIGYLIESRICETTNMDGKEPKVSDFRPNKWLHRGFIFIAE